MLCGIGESAGTMNSQLIWHTIFEMLAWISAIGVGLWSRRRYFAASTLPMPAGEYPRYMVIVWVGAVAGAFALGTVNLMLGSQQAAGRSILGAIVGGVLTAEIYKSLRGIRGSTGKGFVAPLAAGIAVGRLGCFLPGLPDYTYGIPTALPWGVDFGDGIPRHPVQLYECGDDVVFLVVYVAALSMRVAVFVPRVLPLRHVLRCAAFPLGVLEAVPCGLVRSMSSIFCAWR